MKYVYGFGFGYMKLKYIIKYHSVDIVKLDFTSYFQTLCIQAP